MTKKKIDFLKNVFLYSAVLINLILVHLFIAYYESGEFDSQIFLYSSIFSIVCFIGVIVYDATEYKFGNFWANWMLSPYILVLPTLIISSLAMGRYDSIFYGAIIIYLIALLPWIACCWCCCILLLSIPLAYVFEISVYIIRVLKKSLC